MTSCGSSRLGALPDGCRHCLSQWYIGGRHLHGLSGWLPKTGQVWLQPISTYLEELGLTRLSADCGLYYHKKKQEYLLLHVDDVLTAAQGLSWDSSWRHTDPAGPSHLARKATYRGCWIGLACRMPRQSPHHSMMP